MQQSGTRVKHTLVRLFLRCFNRFNRINDLRPEQGRRLGVVWGQPGELCDDLHA